MSQKLNNSNEMLNINNSFKSFTLSARNASWLKSKDSFISVDSSILNNLTSVNHLGLLLHMYEDIVIYEDRRKATKRSLMERAGYEGSGIDSFSRSKKELLEKGIDLNHYHKEILHIPGNNSFARIPLALVTLRAYEKELLKISDILLLQFFIKIQNGDKKQRKREWMSIRHLVNSFNSSLEKIELNSFSATAVVNSLKNLQRLGFIKYDNTLIKTRYSTRKPVTITFQTQEGISKLYKLVDEVTDKTLIDEDPPEIIEKVVSNNKTSKPKLEEQSSWDDLISGKSDLDDNE